MRGELQNFGCKITFSKVEKIIMLINKARIKELYNSALVFVYIVLSYFARVYNEALYHVIVFWGLVLFLHCIFNKRTHTVLFRLFVFIFLVSIISLSRGYVPNNYLILFPSFFFACFIYENKINSRSVLFALCLVSILILYRLITNPLILLGIEHFTEGSSVNFISVILMSILSVYYLLCYKNEEKFSIYPSVLVFFISLVSTSRSAMASMFLVLCAFIYTFVKEKRIDIKNVVRILTAVIIIGLIIIPLSLEYFDINSILENVGDEGFSYSENVRTEMLQDYLSQMNLYTFVCGFDFWASNFYDGYGHPHNTYVIMHRNYGIMCLVLYWMLLKCVFILKRKHFLLLVIYCSLLLRASTDYVFFGNFEDYAIVSFILFSYYLNKKTHNLIYYER